MNARALSISSLLLLAACGQAASKPSDVPRSESGPKAAGTKPTGAPPAAATRVPAGWMVAPTPKASAARLRAILKGAPAALAMLDGLLARGAAFDLERPVGGVFDGDRFVFIAALGKEQADAMRDTTKEGSCRVLDRAAGPELACVSEGPTFPDDLVRAELPTTTNDFHFEASADVWRALVDKQAKKGDGSLPKFFEDTANDYDGMHLDLGLSGTPEIVWKMHVKGKDSVNAVWLKAPVAAPPPAFLQLPADAELALFAHAPPAAEQSALKKAFFDTILSLEAGGSSDAAGATKVPASSACAGEDRLQRAALEKLLFTGGPVGAALGFDRTRAEAASTALLASPQDKKKSDAVRDSLQGWFVMGVEEPTSRWAEGLTEFMKHDCSGTRKRQFAAKKPAAAFGLPAGTTELVVVKAADKTSPASRDVLFVVPATPTRTFVAYGHDEALVAAKMRTVLAGGKGTLSDRPGIDGLKKPAAVGGFVTTAGIDWLAGDTSGPEEILKSAGGVAAMRNLRTGGRTPIAFALTTSRDAKGTGGEIVLRMPLETGAIADVATLVGR